MFLESFVCENSGRADLGQISTELTLKNAILMAAEIDIILRGKGIKIVSAGIVLIESYTTVALNAAVHFVVHEGSEVLILVTSFLERKSSVIMTSHYCHILKVA